MTFGAGRKAPRGWPERKSQIQTLIESRGDDEEEGIKLDRLLLGGDSKINQKKRTALEEARFSDKDLLSFGPLAEAQCGIIELVNCHLDGRVYVRKRISKKFALKTRDQCSPLTERQILLLALASRTTSSCTPRMLCAYQCSNFLNIVMEYAQGGSLWDVLESAPTGRLSAADLNWWAPQCVSALVWLHGRAGFAHRDVKPHNFVVRIGENAATKLLLIDFGSAAMLSEKNPEGVQRIARDVCLVPCGTCDYISPEILKAHEEALVALEMSGEETEMVEREDGSDVELRRRAGSERAGGIGRILKDGLGYGRETDWWSLGVMFYELAFGCAPFFANDIRQTYTKIMNHESHLSFDRKLLVPPTLVNFIKGCLTHHETRLGRHSDADVTSHPYFRGVDWANLHLRTSPPDLLLPQFTFATPVASSTDNHNGEDTSSLSSNSASLSLTSRPFAFSALFNSSVLTPGRSFANSQSQSAMNFNTPASARRSLSRSQSANTSTNGLNEGLASFVGFSWGPPRDAFDEATRSVPAESGSAHGLGPVLQPQASLPIVNSAASMAITMDPSMSFNPAAHPFVTPMRPSRRPSNPVPPSTIRVTASARRHPGSTPGTALRSRESEGVTITDREAMRQLVDCIGMSARKKVLESGKKPRVLVPANGFGGDLSLIKKKGRKVPQLAMDFSGRDKENEEPTPITGGSGSNTLRGSSKTYSSNDTPTATGTLTGTLSGELRGGLGRAVSGSTGRSDVRKELRFDDTTTMHFAPPVFSFDESQTQTHQSNTSNTNSSSRSLSINHSQSHSRSGSLTNSISFEINQFPTSTPYPTSRINSRPNPCNTSSPTANAFTAPLPFNSHHASETESELETETGTSCPPSPSPSPRPGSAMSMLSINRTRSATPTSSYMFSTSLGRERSASTSMGDTERRAMRRPGNSVSLMGANKVGLGAGGPSEDSGRAGKTNNLGNLGGRLQAQTRAKVEFAFDDEEDEENEGVAKVGFMDATPRKSSHTPKPKRKPVSTPHSFARTQSQTRFNSSPKVIPTVEPSEDDVDGGEDEDLENQNGGRDTTEEMGLAFEDAFATPVSRPHLSRAVGGGVEGRGRATPHPQGRSRKSPASNRSPKSPYSIDVNAKDGDKGQKTGVSSDREVVEPQKRPAMLAASTPARQRPARTESEGEETELEDEARAGDESQPAQFEDDNETIRPLDRYFPVFPPSQASILESFVDTEDSSVSFVPFIRPPGPEPKADPDSPSHINFQFDVPSLTFDSSPTTKPAHLPHSSGVDVGGKRDGDGDRLMDLESRLARMRMDIANVSAHLNDFVRWASPLPPHVHARTSSVRV